MPLGSGSSSGSAAGSRRRALSPHGGLAAAEATPTCRRSPSCSTAPTSRRLRSGMTLRQHSRGRCGHCGAVPACPRRDRGLAAAVARALAARRLRAGVPRRSAWTRTTYERWARTLAGLGLNSVQSGRLQRARPVQSVVVVACDAQAADAQAAVLRRRQSEASPRPLPRARAERVLLNVSFSQFDKRAITCSLMRLITPGPT